MTDKIYTQLETFERPFQMETRDGHQIRKVAAASNVGLK